LIHNVLKYAAKTKHPRLRSAFTYCEDEPPSRIDYGKSKYGGPFTIEQVEDVKTFFKLLGIVIIVGASFGITNDKTFMQYTLEVYGHQVLNGECHIRYFITKAYYITVALLIPVNELIIHPLFHRCLPKINCYWKIFLGIAIHTGKYIALSVLLTVAHHHDHLPTSNSPAANVTIQCIFHDNPVSWTSDALDYRLFVIPEIISAISFTLILVGSIEMLCAQVPYSMKGLVIGIFYGSMGIFGVLNNVVVQIFIWKSYLWRTKSILNCGFWYLQIKLIVHLVAFFSILLAVTYYKRRKRDDVLPNEQIFAERYYSQ
jgi:peptide/histidine transporter 3/4